MFRFSVPMLALSAALACTLLLTPRADAHKGGASGPSVEPTEAQKAVRSLKQEIAVLELFNSLQLSSDQKTALSDLVTEVVAERQTKQSRRAELAPKLEKLLRTYLADVERNGKPSENTLDALSELRTKNKPDRESQRTARQNITAELESILSDEQTNTLRSFRPMAAAGPSDEERAERKEHRRERLREHAEEKSGGDERVEERVDQRMDRGMKRRGQEMGRRNVRGLLFSEAMLDLLS